MKKTKRHISFLSSLLSLLMALHLLNFSIDSRDAHPDFVAEDLHYNDIESIVEFTLEVILGVDDAILEYDEADEENGQQAGFLIFYCFPLPAYDFIPFARAASSGFVMVNQVICIENYLDILSPPPRIAA